MQLTRVFPRSYEAISALARRAAHGSQAVVLQAGHFLLHQDSDAGTILPCLEDALHGPRHASIRDNYARFPILTWKLGLRLLEDIPVERKYVMVVVNDWQYLSDPSRRMEFYSAHRSLPESYRAELARHPDISLFQPRKEKIGASTAPFFGEVTLRNRYNRHVHRLIVNGRLPPSAVVDTRADAVYCSLPDTAGQVNEVYCSGRRGNCTGEVAEMVSDSSSRTGATCFISLYPTVCRNHVEHGSEVAVELLGACCRTILNLGFQSTAVRDLDHLIAGTEATLHEWPPFEHGVAHD